MHEHHPVRLIGVAVLLAIVDEHIARMHMLVLVARHAGDDRNAGKMLGCPFDLLRSSPAAERKPGQDRRLQMLDRVEQQPRVGHFG
jgi:hypothetical protein